MVLILARIDQEDLPTLALRQREEIVDSMQHNSCSSNIDQIDYRGQFHQHFTSSFCMKVFSKLLCDYSLVLYFFGQRISAQKLLVKMLIKLTCGRQADKKIRLKYENNLQDVKEEFFHK